MMNLKYYLRGLGIGIFVTALIMSIAAGGKETLSNEEIKERARALGMVEEGTLLEDARSALSTVEDPETGNEEEPEEAPEPSKTDTPEEASGELSEGEPEETPQGLEEEMTGEAGDSQEVEDQTEVEASDEAEVDNEQFPEPDEEPWPSDEENAFSGRDENVTIQVNRGEGSYTVCKRLEEAGLIASASEFDTFLYQNGYDKKIRAGSFEIPAGAGSEQIARILSGAQ